MNKSTNKVILSVDGSDRTISLHTNFRLDPHIKQSLSRNVTGIVFCNTTEYTITINYGKCFEQDSILQGVYKVILLQLKGEKFDVVSGNGDIIATYGNSEYGDNLAYENTEDSSTVIKLMHNRVPVSMDEFKSLMKERIRKADGSLIKTAKAYVYLDEIMDDVLYFAVAEEQHKSENTPPNETCDKTSHMNSVGLEPCNSVKCYFEGTEEEYEILECLMRETGNWKAKYKIGDYVLMKDGCPDIGGKVKKVKSVVFCMNKYLYNFEDTTLNGLLGIWECGIDSYSEWECGVDEYKKSVACYEENGGVSYKVKSNCIFEDAMFFTLLNKHRELYTTTSLGMVAAFDKVYTSAKESGFFSTEALAHFSIYRQSSANVEALLEKELKKECTKDTVTNDIVNELKKIGESKKIIRDVLLSELQAFGRTQLSD